MTVPEGFSVELVAAEPDLVNPVAMTFDERGRVWVTESVEYPRKAPGPGKDRVKILEDTDGDGAVDKVKIFADGLNIPSGVAVGYGGVWVANAPDILFYPDANHDDVPDGPPQVVVTGFGRADTHELPNSLTWGPDGYLYGLNGVFNPCKIEQNGKTFEFTCAMFRIHPRTREFSLFCEGTSNPWGIAFNDVGDAFVSACVIDHLWHLTETGYYHRQGGPYPPFTWKLGSIVDYKHQMAAYCGLHWFDSDAYPEQYRKKLYMGNLHGSCINVDRLEKNGATYKGKPEGDFLSANDVWFMPITQKTGPDGCLYILDWYDRYHCYQDANADPAGVDRLKGRLYRVRYQNTPRAPKFDLHEETDDQLIERLKSPNIFYRDLAQRLLAERNDEATRKKLEAIFFDLSAPPSTRMHALWTFLSSGTPSVPFLGSLMTDHDPTIRAWGARALGNTGLAGMDILQQLPKLAIDADPIVRLQAAIAAPKLAGTDAVKLLLDSAARDFDDPNSLNSHIVWQNLYPLLGRHKDQVLARFSSPQHDGAKLSMLLPHVVNWLFAQGESGVADVAQLASRLLQVDQTAALAATTVRHSSNQSGPCLTIIYDKLAGGELTGNREAALRKVLEPQLIASLSSPTHRSAQAAYVLCHWQNPTAIEFVKQTVRSPVGTHGVDDEVRLTALAAWATSRDPELLTSISELATSPAKQFVPLQRRLFDVLAKYDEPSVATNVLAIYPQLENDLKPAAVELLTSRVAWSNALIDAIAVGKLSKDAVNVNQIGKLLKSGDKKLAARVEKTWGKLRTDRNPQREQVVADMKKLLVGSKGDAVRGQIVYMKLCGQCHKLHGAGQEVGPDITVNGRASFEQLVNNVFDPSLVIGNAYQARTVVTADGRVLTGLLVEDNPQRIVLKLQGGKLETIARGDVEEMEVSKLSLMPEGVEKQLSPQELIDLFALLKLDKSPTDPQSQPLPNFLELK